MMNQHKEGQKTLIVVCGYSGDKQQMLDLLPVYEHHKSPVVFLSPQDSQVHGIGPHICRAAGKRAYVGQLSLDRQYEHFKIMLEYPFDFYLWNDSDSFLLTPEIPQYLYDEPDVLWSNEVNDFRSPGSTWTNQDGSKITWPADYHAGYPLIAQQPPYFFSRSTLQKIVDTCKDIKACPITPFIDFYVTQCCVKAGVRHAPFSKGASCETVTPNGIAVMSECVTKRGAEFVHSIKNAKVMRHLLDLHKKKNGS